MPNIVSVKYISMTTFFKQQLIYCVGDCRFARTGWLGPAERVWLAAVHAGGLCRSLKLAYRLHLAAFRRLFRLLRANTIFAKPCVLTLMVRIRRLSPCFTTCHAGVQPLSEVPPGVVLATLYCQRIGNGRTRSGHWSAPTMSSELVSRSGPSATRPLRTPAACHPGRSL